MVLSAVLSGITVCITHMKGLITLLIIPMNLKVGLEGSGYRV